MSKPRRAFTSPGFVVLSASLGREVREHPGERSRRVVRASGDGAQRLRAVAGRCRLVSVRQRELLRREAKPGRGR